VKTKDTMFIRTHPYMNVLYSTRQATLRDLPSFAGTVVRDLYRYVTDLDLLVCGPQYWFYYGMDGRPTATGGWPQTMNEPKFTVEITLPVQGKIPTAVLPFFKRIPAFRCLSSRYQGPWEGIAEEYKKMLQYIADNELKMNGMYAEAYLHIDFDDPANQITEIQIGIC
jgi:effector-binding domain-containing protein